MSDATQTIMNDMVVSMEYQVRILDGREVGRTENDKPFEFIQGRGQIIPGLEKELYGMAVGEKKEVLLEPAQGYGDRQSERVVEVSRAEFPPDFDLAVGNPVAVGDRETGEEFLAYITQIHPETVVLDFNHPLAGETLEFAVKIVGLRDASEEELAHGHVHGSNHPH